jgi:hypothetical protein
MLVSFPPSWILFRVSVLEMAYLNPYDPDFIQREWKVSGLWNSIFTEAIRIHKSRNPHLNQEWQISPEAYPNDFDTQSNRADLLVSIVKAENNIWNTVDSPVIVFEAKRGKGVPASNNLWRSVRTQLENWCNLADGIERRFPCWAVGTIGNEVKFWIFTGSIMYNGVASRMVPASSDAQGNIQLIWANNWAAGDGPDIGPVYDYNTAQAGAIIEHMLNHPWADGLVHPSQHAANRDDW